MQKNLVILIGPPAVGKMTVGQELRKLTNYKLFHNHIVIEALLPIFDFESTSFKKLCMEFRTRIFEQIIEDPSSLGLIFTFVCDYKSETSLSKLREWISLFQKNKWQIYMIELVASLEERLERNKSENRLVHKLSKRDLVKSEAILMKNEQDWLMEAPEHTFKQFNYLKINNENIEPDTVAKIIVDNFNLKLNL